MNDSAHASPTDQAMFVDTDDRYDLIGLDVIDRDTGKVETFIPFTPQMVDFVGLVESREKSYENTAWRTERVYRTTTRPATAQANLAATITAATEYVALVARIHEAYRHIVMDTPADRALHAQHVRVADDALALAQARLAKIAPTPTSA